MTSTPEEDTAAEDGTAEEEAGADSSTVDSDCPQESPSTRGRKKFLVPIAIATTLIAAVAVPSWLYLTMYRTTVQTSTGPSDGAIEAATTGTVAILTYKPESMQSDFDTAKTHLTGDFLSYYEKFTQEVVTPAVQQKGVRTTAEVVHAGVSSLQPDSASVLLFVNQSTASTQNPEPNVKVSSVNVGLTRVDNSWRISSFDPV